MTTKQVVAVVSIQGNGIFSMYPLLIYCWNLGHHAKAALKKRRETWENEAHWSAKFCGIFATVQHKVKWCIVHYASAFHPCLYAVSIAAHRHFYSSFVVPIGTFNDQITISSYLELTDNAEINSSFTGNLITRCHISKEKKYGPESASSIIVYSYRDV